MDAQEIKDIEGMYGELIFWRDYLFRHVSRLAEIEGLPAHAMSIKVRLISIEDFVAMVEGAYRKNGYDLQPIKAEVERSYLAYEACEKREFDRFLEGRLKHL